MRRVAVALAAALVLGGGAVAARATGSGCPTGVDAVPGTNPSKADISALLEAEAAKDSTPKVPVQILKAVAYVETQWRQYDGGTVVVSSDGHCGVGIMQVTASSDPDPMRLATDIAYNIERGAAILRQKWADSQDPNVSAPPEDRPLGSTDDPAIVENWYNAVQRYNGLSGGDDSYAAKVAETVADPFRRVLVADVKPFMPIRGFLKPKEADETYVFPGAFQARLSPSRFVFYDNNTRAITKTVYAPTHDYRTVPPPVAYPAATYGPDGPGVTCSVSCGGWRLLEGKGVAGRAHYTLSGATQGARLTWAPSLPRSGAYRVTAYVPAAGSAAEPLTTAATYHLGASTVTVDQAARAGSWVSLGDRTLSPGATVWTNDVSSAAAGRRIVADALRTAMLTRLDLTASPTTLTYGAGTRLSVTLTQQGTSTGLGGRAVRLYQRRAGTTTWSAAGTVTTGSGGAASLVLKPARNTEYLAKYVPATTDAVGASSTVRRVNVRPRVTSALSRTSAPRGTSVRVSATVAPSHAGQSVRLQRYYSGGWHDVKTVTLSSSSTASWTVSWASAGTYRYRVYKPADSDHVSGWGATLTLTVT